MIYSQEKQIAKKFGISEDRINMEFAVYHLDKLGEAVKAVRAAGWNVTSIYDLIDCDQFGNPLSDFVLCIEGESNFVTCRCDFRIEENGALVYEDGWAQIERDGVNMETVCISIETSENLIETATWTPANSGHWC